MIGWAVLLFILAFNAAVPVADSLVSSLGAPNTLQSASGFNATVIQTNFGVKQNQTSSQVVTVTPLTPQSSIFGSLVGAFGDWIDAMKYIATALLGMALPYWYLTNDFGLSAAFAGMLNVLIWISYGAIILYYFAFRNPEQ